jgi:hypothetical protein
MITPDRIATTAARIKDAGLPDFLNRWLMMSPDALAREPSIGRILKPARTIETPSGARRHPNTLPKTMTPEAWAILREIEKREKEKTAARIAELKERRTTMVQKPGEKELALRAMREASAARKPIQPPPMKAVRDQALAVEAKLKPEPKAAAPEANKETDDMAKTAKKTASKAAPKAAKPAQKPARAAKKKAAPEAAKPREANGARPGSKLAMVVELLKQPGGTTAAEVKKVTGWPSVSMPAQAKAAGLTLKKEEVDGVTRYSA